MRHNSPSNKMRKTRPLWLGLAAVAALAACTCGWVFMHAPSDTITLIYSPASVPGGTAILYSESALSARTVALFVEDGAYTQGKPAFLRTLDMEGGNFLREPLWSKDRTMVAVFHKYQGSPVVATKMNVAYDFKTHRFRQSLPMQLWRSRGGTGASPGDGQIQSPVPSRVAEFKFPYDALR